MYPCGTRLKSIVKYNNYIAEKSDSLVNFDEFKIVEVPMDGNCLFNSFIVGLKNTKSGKQFFEIIENNNKFGKPENILRVTCFYMFYKLLFLSNNSDTFSPSKEDYNKIIEDALIWKESSYEIPENFVFSKFGSLLMDFYLRAYSNSMENPVNTDNLTITSAMKEDVKSYLEKMIKKETRVDLRVVGFIISNLFHVKIEVAVVNTEQVAHHKEHIIEWISDMGTIYIIYTPLVKQFDSLIVKKTLKKIGKIFNNIKQSQIDMLNQQKTKSGTTLKTEIVPSFLPADDIAFLSVSTKLSRKNNEQNVILPEIIPLYCSQVSTKRCLGEGTVGDFVKIDFVFSDNIKQSTTIQIYMITSNNFTKILFNYQGKPGNYLSMFRFNEHVESDWYKNYSIRIYSYYTRKQPEITLTGYKSKNSEEPIMFSYYISQECKIPDYIFMELSNDNKYEESEIVTKTKIFNSIITTLQKHYS